MAFKLQGETYYTPRGELRNHVIGGARTDEEKDENIWGTLYEKTGLKGFVEAVNDKYDIKGFGQNFLNSLTSGTNPLDKYFAEQNEYVSGLQSNAQSAYDQMLQYYQNAPATYKPSAWQTKADEAMEQYLNRDPFKFDINGDAMYQQLKDQYIQQGNMAMMDTMGQAASMTGGYGNSYAQAVGQQAYHQQLNQLNNMVPQLYGMAQDRYDQEGQNILDRYSLYSDREAQEYEKYQGELENWMSRGQELTDAYTAAQKQYTDATTYKDPDQEMLARIRKDFKNAKDEDDIWSVLNEYQVLGYDPKWLYILASGRDLEL